jgi:hypothetical protein
MPGKKPPVPSVKRRPVTSFSTIVEILKAGCLNRPMLLCTVDPSRFPHTEGAFRMTPRWLLPSRGVCCERDETFAQLQEFDAIDGIVCLFCRVCAGFACRDSGSLYSCLGFHCSLLARNVERKKWSLLSLPRGEEAGGGKK